MTSAAERADPLPVTPFGRPLDASIRVPGSKSLTNRHLVLAALAEGESTLRGALVSDDCERLGAALSATGASIDRRARGTELKVRGTGGRPRGGVSVDLGDGGTPSRFMLAVAALAAEEIVVDGSVRMRERPVREGVALLQALGAEARILGGGGGLPVAMRGASGGGLAGGRISVGRTASSQFISALLLVAPWTTDGIEVEFTEEPTSASYLHLTIASLRDWGIEVEVARGSHAREATAPEGPSIRSIRVPPTPPAAREVEVEPDASSAVYPAALAAILGGRVELEGVRLGGRPFGKASLQGDGPEGLQPDSWFLEDLVRRGARVSAKAGPGGRPSAVVEGIGPLLGADSDYERAPDAAVMGMVVAACGASPSRITGLSTLRVKESDRIASVAAGLEALGGRVETGPDWALVHPLPPRLRPAVVDSARDHRVAMAFAILGAAREGVSIADPAVVEKSWPGFWDDLDLLRGGVSPQNASG